MKDERSLRQVIIDRIEAYRHGFEFYNPELADQTTFDYDAMTDNEIVKAFEMIVFDHQRVKDEYRKNQPEPGRRA